MTVPTCCTEDMSAASSVASRSRSRGTTRRGITSTSGDGECWLSDGWCGAGLDEALTSRNDWLEVDDGAGERRAIERLSSDLYRREEQAAHRRL